MKFTVNPKEFLNGIKQLLKLLNESSCPIELHATKGNLKIEGDNLLGRHVIVNIPAEVQEEGFFKTESYTLDQLNIKNKTTFFVEKKGKDQVMKFKSGNFSGELANKIATETPEFSPIDLKYKVEAKAILDALDHVRISPVVFSHDDVNVRLRVKDKKLTATLSDSYRGVHYISTLDSKDFELLVANYELQMLMSSFNTEGTLLFGFDDSYIRVRNDVIDAQVPKIQSEFKLGNVVQYIDSVKSKKSDMGFVVKGQDLYEALLSVFSIHDSANEARLQLDFLENKKGDIYLQVSLKSGLGFAKDKVIVADIRNTPKQIAFSSNLVLDVLSILSEYHITIDIYGNFSIFYAKGNNHKVYYVVPLAE